MAAFTSDRDISYGPERQPWRETVSDMAVTEDGELLVSPPSTDPLQLDSYPKVPRVTSTCTFYQLPSSGLPSHQLQQAVEETLTLVHQVAEHICSDFKLMRSLTIQFSVSDVMFIWTTRETLSASYNWRHERAREEYSGLLRLSLACQVATQPL